MKITELFLIILGGSNYGTKTLCYDIAHPATHFLYVIAEDDVLRLTDELIDELNRDRYAD